MLLKKPKQTGKAAGERIDLYLSDLGPVLPIYCVLINKDHYHTFMS